jgi:hypothetical protein
LQDQLSTGTQVPLSERCLMAFNVDLTVRVWLDYNKTQLLDVMEGDFEHLEFGTQLNGGFSYASIVVRRDISTVWRYVSSENLSKGRLFCHLEIQESVESPQSEVASGYLTVWEGRIMSISFDPSDLTDNLSIEALGYWSSTKDQWYDDEDAGNTNWATAGASQFDDVVKEMLTKSCPDINSDQSNIQSPGVNINATQAFHERKYVQDHIVDSQFLTDGDGDQWYFAIWEERMPYLYERDLSKIHWVTTRSDLGRSMIKQDAMWWRNNVMPIVGTTEGTEASGSRPTGVPIRDITVDVPTGTPTAQSQDTRDRILAERNQVQQKQSIRIAGEVYRAVGGMAAVPKWRIRAGEIIRIVDLVPSDVTDVTLDNLRTFHVMETEYNASSDVLTITPDRIKTSLSHLLAKEIDIERE